MRLGAYLLLIAVSIQGLAKAESVLNSFEQAQASLQRLNSPTLCETPAPPLALREAISPEEAMKLFAEARDSKALFYRHPSNGCYAIAHIISDLFEKRGVKTRKVMIEGDLNFKTPYAPDQKKGMIHWEWHVATAVKVQSADGSIQDYVIDPATLERPEPIQSWKKKFTNQECTEIEPRSVTQGCQYYFTERYQRYPLFMTGGKLNTEWKSIELEEARNLMKWYQKSEAIK